MKTMTFLKMNGAGNDFIVASDAAGNAVSRDPLTIRALCDRRRGIGADGVIFLTRIAADKFAMDYFNSDGSPAGMCGNGLRCSMEFAVSQGLAASDHLFFSTGAGELEAWRLAPGLIRTRMPLASPFRTVDVCGYECHVTSTGVPHAVILLPEGTLDTFDVDAVGRSIRFSPELAPDGANVDFIELPEADTIRIRTYERGVEAETLACGTGMAAAGAYVYLFRGGKNIKKITCAGGDTLTVELNAENGCLKEIFLSGPALVSFTGTVNLK